MQKKRDSYGSMIGTNSGFSNKRIKIMVNGSDYLDGPGRGQ